MPTLQITTNVKVDDAAGFIKKASGLVAQQTGIPEAYVLIVFTQQAHVSFGGNAADPAAYVELSSVGGFKGNNAKISEDLSSFFKQELGVSPDRAYIKFSALVGTDLGWNGRTF